jgi:hypothetical protein
LVLSWILNLGIWSFPLGLPLSLAAAPAVAPVPQGAELLKVDLLGIFAHPDDETGVAATMARYAGGQSRGARLLHAGRRRR